MSKTYYKFLLYFAIALTFLSLYCALIIGLNSDEPYHHMNGALRFLYLKTLGDFEGYNVFNTRYYPGLYDTIMYSLILIVNKFVDPYYSIEIRHFLNWSFSFLGIIGLFLVNKKIFNKEVAILSCILTLLNPVFFGHMGINPKDPIVFTALIWAIFFFINYLENLQSSRFKHLVLMSIAIGFGCGVRITFVALLLPLLIIWIYVMFQKKIKISSIIIDILLGLLIISFLAFLTWPQIHNGKFIIILEIIERTSNWLILNRHGIINGEFYEIRDTPLTYILKIFLYRIPLYFSLLIIYSYLIFFTKKNFFIEKLGSNFPKHFYILNCILYFPISTMIISSTNIYDNARLFLFTMPLFATIAAISLFYIIISFKKFNLSEKSFSFITFLFLILSVYRFAALSPYQYVYTNYFSTPKFSMGDNKFEHDYLSTSYPELMEKIKKKYGEEKASKLKIRTCNNVLALLKFHFKKILNSEQTIGEKADYVMLTNRNLTYRKKNCFDLYKGEEIVSVKRLGLTLSAFKKIETEEGQVYMTPKWNVKGAKWYKEMRERDKGRRNKLLEIINKYEDINDYKQYDFFKRRGMK